ncbi:MAG: peptidylprolyl isomerase [Lachnospiraceae bacterium]|nr:peptidylprolyl isomerase [Lachnospiraceae bacterium]
MKKSMKWLAPVMMVLLLGMAACGKQESVNSTSSVTDSDAVEEAVTDGDAGADTTAVGGAHHVEITVENYGTIKLELDGDTAPITVANFVKLAKDGFYDGLTFHRIMDGFMIQGGDPNGNGTGGAEQNIKGEFAANGVENHISHVKGVISMARAQDPDSASSQFFIMVADADYLDGQYAAFGHVTEGMEIVEQIAKDARPIDGNGTIPADEQPVITSVVVVD